MTAFRYTRDGVSARYPETKGPRITHFVEEVPADGVLADAGFVIAWPNGEMWTHDHIAQVFTDDDTERAA